MIKMKLIIMLLTFYTNFGQVFVAYVSNSFACVFVGYVSTHFAQVTLIDS